MKIAPGKPCFPLKMQFKDVPITLHLDGTVECDREAVQKALAELTEYDVNPVGVLALAVAWLVLHK